MSAFLTPFSFPFFLSFYLPRAAAQNVLLRDTSYLYDYEGDRLLGFAADKVKEYDVCVTALQRVLKVRPNDVYAEKILRSCEEKGGKPTSNANAASPSPMDRLQGLRARSSDGLSPAASPATGPAEPSTDGDSAVLIVVVVAALTLALVVRFRDKILALVRQSHDRSE